MRYNEEKIDIDIISKISDSARKYYKTRENYEEIAKTEPIFILEEKLKMLKSKVDNENKLEKLFYIISITGNKKAKNLIGRQHDKINKEVTKIYDKVKKSKEIGKVHRPYTSEVLFVEKDGNAFNIGTVLEHNYKNDAYRELFLTAFRNERYRSEQTNQIEEVNPMSRVEGEMEELNDVKRYWGTQEFIDCIKSLEETNPEKAKKYKNSQIKKIVAVEKLTELYEKTGNIRLSEDNISKANQELQNLKNILPENVYNKCGKCLDAQQRRINKEKKKLEKQKNKIFNETNLRQSINNAKQYHDIIDELRGIPKEEVIRSELSENQQKLSEAKKRLPEEEERKVASNATKLEIESISAQISNQEAIIKQQEGIKKVLDDKKYSNIAKEIRETIEGEKINPIALNKGEDEEKTSNANFVPKQKIDHKKAIEAVLAKETSEKDKANETKKSEDRIQ